jgi:hypothetical protein
MRGSGVGGGVGGGGGGGSGGGGGGGVVVVGPAEAVAFVEDEGEEVYGGGRGRQCDGGT